MTWCKNRSKSPLSAIHYETKTKQSLVTLGSKIREGFLYEHGLITRIIGSFLRKTVEFLVTSLVFLGITILIGNFFTFDTFLNLTGLSKGSNIAAIYLIGGFLYPFALVGVTGLIMAIPSLIIWATTSFQEESKKYQSADANILY